ncbi:MAG: hypothetical protein ACI4TT_02265 [Christensenellales bacterium]
MSELNFHCESKKTKLDLELEEYSKKINSLDKEKLQKELEKLNRKLVVPYVTVDTYEIDNKDISKDATEKNRLYMRNVTSSTAKWIGYSIQQSGRDFSSTWNLINATFSSRTINPDFNNLRLALDEGVSFMDTLSLEGLKMYKKFLVSIANSVLFEKDSFETSAKKAKNLILALNEEANDLHFYSGTILPKNWKTYYKYIMQQKSCLDCLKQKEKEDNLSK